MEDVTNGLRELGSDKGGGGQKIGKFCGRHLSMAPKGASIKYVRTKEKEVKS